MFNKKKPYKPQVGDIIEVTASKAGLMARNIFDTSGEIYTGAIMEIVAVGELEFINQYGVKNSKFPYPDNLPFLPYWIFEEDFKIIKKQKYGKIKKLIRRAKGQVKESN
ncbi:hypothetical protein [Elizabethkingia phage TCUEAP1]|nr:hypothetical protein [Elizabethkingia phage TCUEAP1]